MTLNDTWYLDRASKYANPLNSAAVLPVVYGNVSAGVTGQWELPCIDTVNFVYCFANHAVLAQAPVIYADGVVVDVADYTFSESDDYESQGNIATVTFTADQGTAVISARGYGKASGDAVVESPIDVIDDILTVENSFDSGDYNATAKAMAAAKCTGNLYKAAGVINADVVLWDLLQEIAGCFLISIYYDADNSLYMDVDDNSKTYIGAPFISGSRIIFKKAKQSLENLINQCPAVYRYNYLSGVYGISDDGTDTLDARSQSIYGVRKPESSYQFPWCRDSATVSKVQGLIVQKLKDPLWLIDANSDFIGRYDIDVGDIVCVTIKDLYDQLGSELINQFMRVVSVSPQLMEHTVDLTLQDTGKFLTGVGAYADGTYTADGSIVAGNGTRDTTDYA